jgi:hypothetical protein
MMNDLPVEQVKITMVQLSEFTTFSVYFSWRNINSVKIFFCQTWLKS